MHKIYSCVLLFLSLYVVCCPDTHGQNIDFFAEIDMDAHPNLCPGKIFGDSTTEAGPKGTWSLGTYGPATVYENDLIWYVNSMSRFLTDDERDSLGAPPGSFWMQKLLIQENIPAPDYLERESNRPVNDIGMLLDWTLYESGTISYVPPPYEAGKAYGFFVHVLGMGDGPDEIVNTDNNEENNWAVKKVVWGCDPVSIEGLLSGDHTDQIRVYPNPVTDKVNFDHTFASVGNLKITLRTITGNIVMQQSEKITTAGIHHFSLNIAQAGLSNGLYLLELNDGHRRACARLAVQR